MREVAQKQNLIFQWFSWQFLEIPRKVLKAWKNFLKFYLDYFCVPLLIKTFFSPWRRYVWSYPRGFDAWKYFETFFSNLISRILGAFLRFFLIIIGTLVEILIFFGGAIVFILALTLPVLILFSLWFGINIIL